MRECVGGRYSDQKEKTKEKSMHYWDEQAGRPLLDHDYETGKK